MAPFTLGNGLVCSPFCSLASSSSASRTGFALSSSSAKSLSSSKSSIMPKQLSIYVLQHRGVFHIPLLLGVKILAAFTIKKLAIVAIVNKLGVERTIALFRQINQTLYDTQRHIYGQTIYETVCRGIVTLENTIKSMRESEKLNAIWDWVQSMEKSNPTFTSAVMSSYLDKFPPYKWMKTVMREAEGKREEDDTKTASSTTNAQMASMSEADYKALMTRMNAAFPEIKDYHVVLIPKAPSDGAAATNANNANNANNGNDKSEKWSHT